MQNAYLQSLHGIVPLHLPSSWEVLTIADFKNFDKKPEISTLVTKALDNPVAAPAFEERLSPNSTVCIIIEDLTRASPKKAILAMVLQRLRQIGIAKENMAIVMALGTHRPLSAREFERAFGRELVNEYRFYNHDCHAADLVPVGRLDTGAVVQINRCVYEADYRIGIGSIFPHPLNGFGGGGKILFPGVANFEAIVEHHLKHSFRGHSRLGNLAGNMFYEQVTAMALAGKLDFIINSVLNHSDELFDVVCGDPVQAHRAGAAVCKGIISQTFSRKSDVTIISAFPYSEGPQIMKPLAPAEMITRPGGCIILYADCNGPLPERYYETCEDFRKQYGHDLRRAVLEHFEQNRRIMAEAPPELNMSMAQVMLALNDFHVILVTRDIAVNQIKRLGFLAAEHMDAAIAMAAELYLQPTVNIVPSGGVILPVVR